jgi:hypothetical protein
VPEKLLSVESLTFLELPEALTIGIIVASEGLVTSGR